MASSRVVSSCQESALHSQALEPAEINGETCHALDSEQKETIYMRKIIVSDISSSKTAGYKPVDKNFGVF
jgi:hypothetical protein